MFMVYSIGEENGAPNDRSRTGIPNSIQKCLIRFRSILYPWQEVQVLYASLPYTAAEHKRNKW